MKIKVLFFVILIFALLVRGYNFHSWFVFEYDQEINAQIAKAIIVDHKFTLIGPETSVGGMYVGPYYNYLIALFYLLGNMNPYSMVFLNLLISGATLYLIYYTGRKLFSPVTGLFAAFLYGFSSLVVNYDRVAWNPTPIPLVTTGMFLFLLLFRKEKKFWQLIVSAIFAGFSLQLHLNALFLFAYFFFFTIFFTPLKQLLNPKKLIPVAVVFSLFVLPLFLFDIRHQFLNSSHFIKLLFGSSSASSGNIFSSFFGMLQIIIGLFSGILISSQSWARTGIVFVIFIWWLSQAATEIKKKEVGVFIFSLLFFVLGVTGFSFYHGALPPQYFLFLFPMFILVTASLISRLFRTKTGKVFVVGLLGVFLVVNLPKTFSQSPFSFEHKLQAVSFILNDAKGRPFTISYVTSPGQQTGFKYIFWYKGGSQPTASSGSILSYKIVIFEKPYEKAENTYSFGRVDVVKNNE